MIKTNQPPIDINRNPIMDSWLKQLVQNINGIFVPAPAHDNSPGTQGQIAFDDNFFYVCTSTDTWARVAIAGGW